jgi:hypothetical protein
MNGPNLKWHSKIGPFNVKTILDHLNAGLAQYWDRDYKAKVFFNPLSLKVRKSFYLIALKASKSFA